LELRVCERSTAAVHGSKEDLDIVNARPTLRGQVDEPAGDLQVAGGN
jgi:hypothetical protein